MMVQVFVFRIGLWFAEGFPVEFSEATYSSETIGQKPHIPQCFRCATKVIVVVVVVMVLFPLLWCCIYAATPTASA